MSAVVKLLVVLLFFRCASTLPASTLPSFEWDKDPDTAAVRPRALEALRASALSAHPTRADEALRMALGGGCVECTIRRVEQSHSRLAEAVNRNTAARIATVGGSITAGGGSQGMAYPWVNQLEFMRPSGENYSCIPSRWADYEKSSGEKGCGASRGIFNLGEGGVSSSFTSLCLDSLVTQRCGFNKYVSRQMCGLDWPDLSRAPVVVKKHVDPADVMSRSKRRQTDWAAEDSRITSLTEKELGLNDIYVIEFLVNDCSLGHDQAAFERLLRHILNLPSKPAVVLLLLELRPPIDVKTGLGGRVDEQCRPFHEGEDDVESVKTRLEIPFEEVDSATERREGPFDVAAAMLALAHHLDLPVIDLRAAFKQHDSLDVALPLLLANGGGKRNSHPNNLGHSYIAYVVDEFLAGYKGKHQPSRAQELPAPLLIKSEEGGTSCLFTSEVIAELNVKKKKTVLEQIVPDAVVLVGSKKLTFEGPWFFHDGLKDVNSYRVDRKYVAELQPQGALHIHLLAQGVKKIWIYHLASRQTEDTLCCTATTRNYHPHASFKEPKPAVTCLSNHHRSNWGYYMPSLVTNTTEDLASVSCSLHNPRPGATFLIRAIFISTSTATTIHSPVVQIGKEAGRRRRLLHGNSTTATTRQSWRTRRSPEGPR